jgi:hypothetical protein
MNLEGDFFATKRLVARKQLVATKRLVAPL